MATVKRNTGTHFRYDADDSMWHAKVRVVDTATDGERFHEFVTQVATLLELLTWLAAIFNGSLLEPDVTVAGHPEPITITGP
jgi:hypothetical protein